MLRGVPGCPGTAGGGDGTVTRDSAHGPSEFAVLAAGLRDLIGRLPEDVSVRGAAKAADVPKNTAFAWLTEGRFPQEIDGMLRLVRAVRKMAEVHSAAGLDDEMAALLDEQRWRQDYRAEATSRAAAMSAGMRAAQAQAAI